jgi:uncharacterized protein YbdZ (MbtH family)
VVMNEAKKVHVKVVKTNGVYSLHPIDYVVPSGSYVVMLRISRSVYDLYFARSWSEDEIDRWQYFLELCYHRSPRYVVLGDILRSP